MRSTTMIMAPFAALALAACGSNTDADGDGKISNEEVAAEASNATLPEPGLYKITVEIEEMSIPGMPAEMAEQMKQSTAAQMTVKNCLTDADRENMVKEMAPQGDQCTYDKYSLSGGKIDAKVTCKTPDGGTAVTTMAGTVSSTGVEMVMENTQTGGAAQAGTHMKMRMKNQRIGECKA
jgi:hypothetical protein